MGAKEKEYFQRNNANLGSRKVDKIMHIIVQQKQGKKETKQKTTTTRQNQTKTNDCV